MRVSLKGCGGSSSDDDGGGESCGSEGGYEGESGGRGSGSSEGQVHVDGDREGLKGMLSRLEGLRGRER